MASRDTKRNSQKPAGNEEETKSASLSITAHNFTTTSTTNTMTPQLASTSPIPMNQGSNNTNNSNSMMSSTAVVVAVTSQQHDDDSSPQQQQQQQQQLRLPVVLRDARFRAGRTLVQSGRASEGATDLFATLLEEARNKYGEAHIETAAAYYEYGNAIFRSILSTIDETEEENVDSNNRHVAAAGAADSDIPTNDVKMAAKETINGVKPGDDDDDDEEMEDGDEEENDDVQLALEMMETAWSILDEYVTTATARNSVLPSPSVVVTDYTEWALEEIPRVLVGIGDVLSHLTRHADAADALSRALPYREQALNRLLAKHRLQQQSKSIRVITNDDDGLPKELISFEHLKCRRQLAEVNVLVAEELLACPGDQDVVTSESNDVLVTAAERVEFAGGYYDKARDELQETVYLLGKLSARIMGTNNGPKVAEFAKAKEDVCFLATLIMGVGENLSVLDEAKARKEAAKQNVQQPPVKKQRT